MIKTLLLIAILGSSEVAQEAQKWNGKFFKRGQSARCADFVGEVVTRSGGTPPVGYQKCTSWLGWGKKVSLSNIQKGDIVIYSSNGRYNHIGIYIGNKEIIHRPTLSKPVGTMDLHYRKIIGIRRK
tara:strand:+ start:75152 stop:75529 length:378 start_codon:yes stop_codon:yes gene_type:complete